MLWSQPGDTPRVLQLPRAGAQALGFPAPAAVPAVTADAIYDPLDATDALPKTARARAVERCAHVLGLRGWCLNGAAVEDGVRLELAYEGEYASSKGAEEEKDGVRTVKVAQWNSRPSDAVDAVGGEVAGYEDAGDVAARLETSVEEDQVLAAVYGDNVRKGADGVVSVVFTLAELGIKRHAGFVAAEGEEEVAVDLWGRESHYTRYV